MRAGGQPGKAQDAPRLTLQSSDIPMLTSSGLAEYSALPLECYENSTELAPSTATGVDQPKRHDCPARLSSPLLILSLQHHLKSSALPALQIPESYVNSERDPISGSTCVRSPSDWSTATYVSASEHWDDLDDKVTEDKEKAYAHNDQAVKASTSGSPLKAQRIHLWTGQNIRTQEPYSAPWPKVLEPWSVFNLRNENHGDRAVSKNVLRSSIAPQRDEHGLTLVKLPILRPEVDWQVSSRLLKMLPVLNPRTHPGRANNLFNDLDILIGDLRNRFPTDIVVLGLVRASERLEVFYMLDFAKTSKYLTQWLPASGEAVEGSDDRTAKGGSRYPTACLPSSITSATAPHYGKQPGDENTASDDPNSLDGPQLSGKRRKPTQKIARRLACPIRRYQEFHHLPLGCGFDGAGTMFEVTEHLRRRLHRNSMPVLVLCRRCWMYVTDQDEYRTIHKENLCEKNSQPRGARVPEQWEQLYRSIYPGSDRIPSPWIDDLIIPSGLENTTSPSGALSSLLDPTQSLSSLNNVPATETGSVNLTVPQSSNHQAIPLTEQQTGVAAVDLCDSMFQDTFLYPEDLGDYDLNQLVVEQARQLPPERIQQFANRFRDRADEFVDRLQLQAENNTPQVPALPTSDEATLDLSTPLHSPAWLEQFPVPDEMLVNAFDPAAPAEEMDQPDY